MRRLENKTAVVAGAACGIGRSNAIRFAKEGASLVVADLDASSAARIAEETKTGAGRARSHPVDVGDPAQVQELISTASRDFARIDVLVNVAGVGPTKLFWAPPWNSGNTCYGLISQGAFCAPRRLPA